jgi:hypothetical protein
LVVKRIVLAWASGKAKCKKGYIFDLIRPKPKIILASVSYVKVSSFAMGKRGLSLLLILLSIFLVACYSKDFEEPGIADTDSHDISRTFRVSYNEAWNAAMEILKEYPVVSAKKDTGWIMTDWMSGKSDRLYSGYGESRIPYTIRYKFSIRLKPHKRGTEVSVFNKEQYYTDAVTGGLSFEGSLYKWIDTESSTQKEDSFLNKMQESLVRQRGNRKSK